jgi:hypothetical protein
MQRFPTQNQSSYHAYCYSREHPFGGEPIVFCAYGIGAEQLGEQQRAEDPEALTQCHRMGLDPNESPLATTHRYRYNDCKFGFK